MDILSLLVGLAAGSVAVFLISQARQSALKQKLLRDLETQANELNTQNMLLKGKLDSVEKEIISHMQELKTEREKVIRLSTQNSTLDANYKNLQQKLEEHKKEVADLQQRFTVEFKHLAQEIFEEKSKKFTDQNKTNITELLNPLKEKIGEFERKVEESNKENLKWNTSLSSQITSLKELNQQITKEAENLTKALKGESKTRGNWGEIILESILEKSGLEKGREYLIQESYVDDSGRRLQPDVVINLPDNKHIVVDSKVALVDYERYVNCLEESDRLLCLKAHIAALRGHVKNLSDKGYQKLYKLQSLDFVLLFVPIEPAFSIAIQHDHSIFMDAYEKNIIIVSPSTLFATLRTIANIWKNEYQNRNALEIARQSGDLFDKFVSFSEDLIKVGTSLDSTQKVYKDAMNKLYEGKGNLVNRAKRIQELGAKTSKNLDQRLLDRSDEE